MVTRNDPVSPGSNHCRDPLAVSRGGWRGRRLSAVCGEAQVTEVRCEGGGGSGKEHTEVCLLQPLDSQTVGADVS